MHQHQTAFENIVKKGEIAHNKQFLLFPQCFQLGQIIAYPFVHIFDIVSLFSAELEMPEIGKLGKRFKAQQEMIQFLLVWRRVECEDCSL